MSYLLDALKKLEEQRPDAQKSDLLVVQGRPRLERKRRTVWPYILSAALLVNAGVAVWLLGPWRTGSSAVPRPKTAAPSLNSSPAVAVHPTEDVLVPLSATRDGVPADVRDQKPAPKPTSAPARQFETSDPSNGTPKKDLPASPGRNQSHHVVGTVPSTKPPPRITPPEVHNATVTPSTSEKIDLSGLRLSLHSYSPDRKSRLVRIDERTMREGDTLATGVVVEEITPDGVILNNKGSRTNIKVQN